MLNNKYEFYLFSSEVNNPSIKRFKSLNAAIKTYNEDTINKNIIYYSLGVSDEKGEIDLIYNKNGINTISNDYKLTHFNNDKLITVNVMNILKDEILNKKKYSNYIISELRSIRDLEENDNSSDDEINLLSRNEVFNELCDYEGLVGYGRKIKDWIKDIYGINLDEIN